LFYLWEYKTTQRTRFFSCGIEPYDGWLEILWITGGKIESGKLPGVLKYNAENQMKPEDFPLTSDTEFLVSERIVKILQDLKTPGVDYYKSEIIQPNGNVIKDYCTLNILNVLDCLDKENSKYMLKSIGPSKVYRFKRISLEESKIPEGVRLFRIKEKRTLVFADQYLKDAFEGAKITGVRFVPISEGEAILGDYEE